MGSIRPDLDRPKRVIGYLLQVASRAARWLAKAAEPISKWATTAAVVGGAVLAYDQFYAGGGANWALNLSISTEVVPYHNDLALLVVHVHSKNQRNIEVDINPPDGKFELQVRALSAGKQSGSVIDPEDGAYPQLTKPVNLLPPEGYLFSPGADYDDAKGIVLPLGSKVMLTARLEDKDSYVSTSSFVNIELPTAALGTTNAATTTERAATGSQSPTGTK